MTLQLGFIGLELAFVVGVLWEIMETLHKMLVVLKKHDQGE
jgi:hypothetical protein